MADDESDVRRVVAAMLDDARLIDACQQHDFGALFRLLNHRGVKIDAIARCTNNTSGRIYEYMKPKGGHRIEKFSKIEDIADGLHIPGHLLGLAPRAWEKSSSTSHHTPRDDKSLPSSEAAWDASPTVEAISLLTRRDLMLDRRDINRAFVGMSIVGGEPLTNLVDRWLTPMEPYDGGQGYIRLGPDEVQELEYSAFVFRQWDHERGGGLRRKAVIGQLNEVAQILRDADDSDVSNRLFHVMAELAETAAMMSWDSGLQAIAQRYYFLALRAARLSGDRPFGANILASMARQLLYMERPKDALELIRLAQDGAEGHATPRVRSMLYTREAWAYAKLGRVPSFWRATGKAEDTYAEAGHDDDPFWIHYFDESELAGVTGGRLLDIAQQGEGEPKYARDAVRYITKALELRPPKVLRSSALDQAGLAQAFFLSREPEQGAAVGIRAVEIATHTKSDRVRAQLADLYQLTVPYRRVSGVREFSENLRDTLAS